MSEDKTRHTFDMNQCKRGDKLVSIHGEVRAGLELIMVGFF